MPVEARKEGKNTRLDVRIPEDKEWSLKCSRPKMMKAACSRLPAGAVHKGARASRVQAT